MTIAFDSAYYLRTNPDVKAAVDAGITTALQHWQTVGYREGRNPSGLFQTSYYLSKNPDVAAAGINPLTHFNSFGAKEGRVPTAVFDAAFYLAHNADVAAAVKAGSTTAFSHFLSYGLAEGRAPGQQVVSSFNATGYLAANPDVSAAVAGGGLKSALQHYLMFGAREGRQGGGVDLASFTRAVSGKASDGYLSGATVFIDRNGNGVLDPGEPSVQTDAQGNFSFGDVDGGMIVVTGGVDSSTGQTNHLVLKAPAGATAVTPLTTLVADAVAKGVSADTAQSQIERALGIPGSVDLSSFDPIAAARSSDAGSITSGVSVQAQLAKIASLMEVASAMFEGGVSASVTSANQAATDGLLSALLSAGSTGPANLDGRDFVKSVLAGGEAAFTSSAGYNGLAAANDAVGNIVAALDTKIDALIATATNAADIDRIAAAQGVAGNAATSLNTGFGTGSLDSSFAALYGGVALDQAVRQQEAQYSDLAGDLAPSPPPPPASSPPPPPPVVVTNLSAQSSYTAASAGTAIDFTISSALAAIVGSGSLSVSDGTHAVAVSGYSSVQLGSGADTLVGAAGGPTGLTIDLGSGTANVADYSATSAGVAFVLSGSSLTAAAGGIADMVQHVAQLKGGSGVNSITSSSGGPSNLAVNLGGNVSDSVTYAGFTAGLTVTGSASGGFTVAAFGSKVDTITGASAITLPTTPTAVHTFIGAAPSGLTVDLGTGSTTADYSGVSSGVTVTQAGTTLTVSLAGATDTLLHAGLLKTPAGSLIIAPGGPTTQFFMLGGGSTLDFSGDTTTPLTINLNRFGSIDVLGGAGFESINGVGAVTAGTAATVFKLGRLANMGTLNLNGNSAVTIDNTSGLFGLPGPSGTTGTLAAPVLVSDTHANLVDGSGHLADVSAGATSATRLAYDTTLHTLSYVSTGLGGSLTTLATFVGTPVFSFQN